MTLKELNQYRIICEELKQLQIELRTEHVTVTGSDAEYPYLKHVMSVDGAEQTRENDLILTKIHECQKRKLEIEKFISSIPDYLTQRIFEIRYINGKNRPSWVKVAHILGGGNNAENVRATASRYVKKH